MVKYQDCTLSHFNSGEVEMDIKITLVILEKWPYLFCLTLMIVIL